MYIRPKLEAIICPVSGTRIPSPKSLSESISFPKGSAIGKTMLGFQGNRTSEKIIGNIARDQKNYELLRELGWHVFVIWECELKRSVMEKTLDSLINNIKQGLQSATNL